MTATKMTAAELAVLISRTSSPIVPGSRKIEVPGLTAPEIPLLYAYARPGTSAVVLSVRVNGASMEINLAADTELIFTA